MLVQNQACAPATNPSILNFSQDSDIFVAYQNLLECTPEQFLLHKCTGFLIAKQISSLAQLGSMMSAAGHVVVIERIVQDWAFNPAQAEGLWQCATNAANARRAAAN